MMHQCDQRMVAADLYCRLGKRTISESISDNRMLLSDLHQPLSRPSLLLLACKRKAITEVHDFDLPTQAPKLAYYPAIIHVAAGRAVEITRDSDRNILHHKSASYQARATCDSDSVTRIALSSRPSRPNLPARAASASRSQIYLVRNSVVVLVFVNSGMSS